ncbi:552_t:CDS:1, partial [Scutellospora calospora]
NKSFDNENNSNFSDNQESNKESNSDNEQEFDFEYELDYFEYEITQDIENSNSYEQTQEN